MAGSDDISEDDQLFPPDEEFDKALLDLDEASLNPSATTSTSPQKPSTGESRWRRSVTANETTVARKRGLPEGQEGADDTYSPLEFGEFGRYMRNKRAKLQNQNAEFTQHDGGKPQIFRKLAVYINGWTGPVSLPELQNILISHGGRYVPYLDKKGLVTHIIATNLTPSKRKEFAAYKVARPEWLLESAAEGKLKDWRAYALLAASAPEERVVDEYEEERGGGTQSAQRSLFAMMGGAGKGKEKEKVETIESLSARGARLAREALKAQEVGKSASSSASTSTLNSFFQNRPAAPSPLSRPGTPTKRKAPAGEPLRSSPAVATPERGANLPATTDSPNAPTAITHPWLPKAQRSERQNALLQDDQWLNEHSSRSPDFLAGYFAQSRLHHLSSFKEELKLLVARHYAEHPPLPKKSKKKLTGSAADGRTVMHVDLDMFFVSAGLTTRPELRGKPVAVCHSRGKDGADASTSEIASCSYEARAAGVKNGMSLGRGRELCPEIQTIPFEFDLYKEISLKFYYILLSHASFLQAGSMDEVFLEVSVPPTITRELDPALALAETIRNEIHAATGCHASIGIGHNLLLARLATRKAKPAGAFHLLSEDVADFLSPLSVDDLPGIGWSMRDKLDSELGVKTVGDLLRFSKFDLTRAIGPKNAETYMAYAKGLDARELSEGKERQSVSSEVNYGIRFAEGRHDQAERFVRELAAETARRLQTLGLMSRLLNLKLMVRHPDAPVETPKALGHGWCDTTTKPSGLVGPNGATDDPTIIADTAVKLLRSCAFPPHELRGIGIQLQKLERDGRPVDAVREKGQGTLSFGAAPLKAPVKSRPTPLPVPLPDRTPSPADAPPSVDAPPPRPRADATLPPPAPTLPPPPQQRRTPPTPLRKEPSIIVLDSDDEDDATPTDSRSSRTSRSPQPASVAAAKPPPPPPAKRVPAKRQPEPYIPSMFRPTKKSVAPPSTAGSISDKELRRLGVEPAVYHELPPDFQREALAQARGALPPPAKKSKTAKGKEVDPPPAPVADLTPSSSSPAASASRPDVIVLPPTPDAAPTETQRVRDIFGDDTWGAMGSRTQKEAVRFLQRQDALSVKGNRSTSTSSSSRPSAPVKDVKIRLPPRFDGQSDLDSICDSVEQWVDEAQDGPSNDDLEALGRFVEKCAKREKGHDLKKATDVMQWWSCVIEGAHGSRGMAEGAGRVWWERFEEVLGRLEWVVLKETGCRLKL
ncbi:hypothetical protein JCM6882_002678 [Rhodosporidiobolus microsporus]